MAEPTNGLTDRQKDRPLHCAGGSAELFLEEALQVQLCFGNHFLVAWVAAPARVAMVIGGAPATGMRAQLQCFYITVREPHPLTWTGMTSS